MDWTEVECGKRAEGELAANIIAVHRISWHDAPLDVSRDASRRREKQRLSLAFCLQADYCVLYTRRLLWGSLVTGFLHLHTRWRQMRLRDWTLYANGMSVQSRVSIETGPELLLAPSVHHDFHGEWSNHVHFEARSLMEIVCQRARRERPTLLSKQIHAKRNGPRAPSPAPKFFPRAARAVLMPTAHSLYSSHPKNSLRLALHETHRNGALRLHSADAYCVCE